MKGSRTKVSKVKNTDAKFLANARCYHLQLIFSTQIRQATKEFLPQGKEGTEKAVAGVMNCIYFSYRLVYLQADNIYFLS